jgi:NADH-quinone oxidoreductase subunit L
VSELAGPLQRVVLTGLLCLIPAALLLAALLHLAIGVRAWLDQRRAKKLAAEDQRLARQVAVSGALLALGAAGWASKTLADEPAGHRYLLQHVWRLVRFGQLDAGIDLALDPLAAAMCVAITSVAALVIVGGAVKDWRALAWMELLIGSALVLVLADNVVLALFGWEGLALAAWGLGANGMKAFIAGRLGDAALLAGAAVTFWGLGGTWSDSDYIPDLNPRFSAVIVDGEAGAKADTTGDGFLTLTAYAGSLVFMDDSHTPLQDGGGPLVAPFTRYKLKGGIHTFRIHPGGGLDDYLVSHVALGGGRELELAPFGATVIFRQIHDHLVVTDAKGEKTYRLALAAKRAWGSVGVVTLACLLFLGGAAAKSAQVPLHGWLVEAARAAGPASALVLSIGAAAGVYVALRLGFLFAMSSAASAVAAWLGAGTAAIAAAAGAFEKESGRALAYVAIAELGLAFATAAFSGEGAGAVGLVMVMLSVAALVVVLGLATSAAGSTDLAALVGSRARVPGAAGTYSLACLAAVGAPMIMLTSGSAVALLVVRAVAGTLVSLAVWRTYFVAFTDRVAKERVENEPTSVVARATWLLALLALASLGGPWVAYYLGAERAGPELGPLVAGLGAALIGYILAKARYGTKRPIDWAERDERVAVARVGATIGGGLESAALAVVARLRGASADAERWVIDGLVNATGVLTRAAAWTVAVFDEKLVDAPATLASTAALRASGKLHVGAPRLLAFAYAVVAALVAAGIALFVGSSR